MVQVTFIEADGTRREIDAREGEPLMYAAREAGVVGIFTTIDALAFLREILFIQYGTDPERSEQ